MAERVMVFIDGSNLYHSVKGSLGRTDLVFDVFVQKLVGERHLVRAYYYNAPVDQAKEAERYRSQQAFFYLVQHLPYFELRLGRLIYGNWPTVPPYEKGIDVKIATDMLVHGFRGNYDVVILVSGDGDFADALQAVKDLGKHVEVALFGSKWTSQHLRQVADRVISLDQDFLSGCWK